MPAVPETEALELSAIRHPQGAVNEGAVADPEHVVDMVDRAHLLALCQIRRELGDVVALPLRDEVVHLLGEGLDGLWVVECLLGEVAQLVAHHRHEGLDHDVAQAPVGEDGLLRVAGVRYLRVGDRVGRHNVADGVDGARLHKEVALVAPRAVQPLHDLCHGVALGRGA